MRLKTVGQCPGQSTSRVGVHQVIFHVTKSVGESVIRKTHFVKPLGLVFRQSPYEIELYLLIIRLLRHRNRPIAACRPRQLSAAICNRQWTPSIYFKMLVSKSFMFKIRVIERGFAGSARINADRKEKSRRKLKSAKIH